MHELYDLKKKLCEELKSYGAEKLTTGSLETIDKLAHALKNIEKVIEAEEGYSGDYSGRRSYDRAYDSYANRSYDSYASRDMSRDYSGKRDSMGRYARDSKMASELREMRNMATDEFTRKEFDKLIAMMEEA